MEKINLEYLSLIKYALENIDKIKNVNDITSKFKDSIKDITKEAHDRVDSVSQFALFHKYIGQENYFFKFQEDDVLFGEFSLDFLPINGNEHAVKSLLQDNYLGEKRLANFRIQLFLRDQSSYSIMEEKNKEVTDYINGLYGKPNSSPEVIEFAHSLEGQFNKKINSWHTKRDETDYFISYYYVDNVSEIGHYLCFSISEYLTE